MARSNLFSFGRQSFDGIRRKCKARGHDKWLKATVVGGDQ